MRVVWAVEIGAVARRKEAAGPDVELGRKFQTRHRVQHADLVVDAVIFGIEHEFDLVGHQSVNPGPPNQSDDR